MIFQKRIERAFSNLRERAGERKKAAPYQDEIILEKGDKLAMILSALLVIVPVALAVLLVMVGVAALWAL